MKEIIELVFFMGGSVLVWGKIASVVLGVGLVVYGCHKFNQLLNRIRLLKEYSECQ